MRRFCFTFSDYFFILSFNIRLVTPRTFTCIYSYFPTIWYVKIRVIFLYICIQFSYTSLPKFPPKFRQSLPYIGRSQVIDIYHVYTSNISYLITQSQPNCLGSPSHKHHYHHNHNILSHTLNNKYRYREINEINTHTWNMIIWISELSLFSQVQTSIIQIKLYKCFNIS